MQKRVRAVTATAGATLRAVGLPEQDLAAFRDQHGAGEPATRRFGAKLAA
jgi:hypothetical protein